MRKLLLQLIGSSLSCSSGLHHRLLRLRRNRRCVKFRLGCRISSSSSSSSSSDLLCALLGWGGGAAASSEEEDEEDSDAAAAFLFLFLGCCWAVKAAASTAESTPLAAVSSSSSDSPRDTIRDAIRDAAPERVVHPGPAFAVLNAWCSCVHGCLWCDFLGPASAPLAFWRVVGWALASMMLSSFSLNAFKV